MEFVLANGGTGGPAAKGEMGGPVANGARCGPEMVALERVGCGVEGVFAQAGCCAPLAGGTPNLKGTGH